MKRALVLVPVALALAGCGAGEGRFGDLHVTATGRIVLRTVPRPSFPGPRAHLRDVVFTSPRRGFVATSGPGTVQRTDDGGDTWHDVLRASRGAELEWLAAAPGGRLFAGGFAHARPFISSTADAGATWSTERPRLEGFGNDAWPYLRVTFVTPGFGYAVPDPAAYGMGAFAVTRDGGRSWRALPVPRGTEAMQFVDVRRGFAAGSVPGQCAGAAWRTADGGATWTRIFCGGVPLAAVQFLDGRHGFVAGGWPAVSEQAPSGILYATGDGGRTWSRRFADLRPGYRGGIFPIVSLRFLDARRGWARTGQCKEGASGPCAGEVLVTGDGGRTWGNRGLAVDLTTVGTDDAWLLPRCDIDCSALWRTQDAGRRWTPLATPANAVVYGVDTNHGLIALLTDVARFVGMGGERWRLGDRRILGAAPGFSVGPRSAPDGTFTASVADRTTAFALVEPHGIELERCGLGATMRILVTRDHGRTWRRTGSFRAYSVAADGAGVFAVAQRQNCRNVLASSGDAGRSWKLRALPQRNCAVSLAGRSVWLRCGRTLFVSSDAGATWRRLRGPEDFAQADIAADGGGAWLALRGHLWRSTDRGHTWTEVWPRLPTP